MVKSILAGVVALALVLGCGVAEVIVIQKRYEALHQKCLEVISLVKDEALTDGQFAQFQKDWTNLREISELLLPHQDVYEINLRMAEAVAYIEEKDYKQLLAQLCVVEDLLRYVPHLMTPSFNHIV